MVNTTLSSKGDKGATVIEVHDQSGFAVGDYVLIGGQETKQIMGFSSIVLDSPLSKDYDVNTTIQKVPPLPQPVGGGSSSGIGASSGAPGKNSSTSSSSIFQSAWATALLIVGCCLICCLAVACALNRPKQKKRGTDREAMMKKDFMERQPLVDQEAAHQAEPMTQSNIMTDGLGSLPPPPPPKEEEVGVSFPGLGPPNLYAPGQPQAGPPAAAPQTMMYAQPGMQLGVTSPAAYAAAPGAGSMYTGSMYTPVYR